MEHREIEEKIRTAVKQTAPNQLEDILSRCEGDTEAPIRLPRSTRRRPALAALADMGSIEDFQGTWLDAAADLLEKK